MLHEVGHTIQPESLFDWQLLVESRMVFWQEKLVPPLNFRLRLLRSRLEFESRFAPHVQFLSLILLVLTQLVLEVG